MSLYLYLSGPMTGLPEFNYPAFHAAAAWLRARGHRVFNPAENRWVAAGLDFPMREGFAEYCRVLCLEVEAIVLMPGWQDSLGARAEYHLAVACGLSVYSLDDLADPRPAAACSGAAP